MENSDLGESSCRKKTNDDKMSEGERPLKKAKYPWQVKGKCHLKDQENANDNKFEDMDTNSDETKENHILIDTGASSTSNNLEILGDYLLKKDFNIPPGDSSDSDGVSSKSDMEEDDGAYEQTTIFTNTENISTNRLANNSTNNGGNQISEENHPSLLDDKNFSIDTCIARWQARQIAKGFVDNTINRVLDSWLVAPLPQTYDDSHNLALDVAEFIDNLPANNTVENEGILMAVSAHGLQNNQNTSRNTATESRSQRRSYGSRMKIAISECVSRNDNANSDQDSNHSNSTDTVNILSQSECLSDVDNKDQESGNICQPIPTTSASSSLSTIRLDHRKSHSENELCSTLLENRSAANISWRPVPQPCNCSHTARRTNLLPNIPFHKRNSHAFVNSSTTNCSSSAHSTLHDHDIAEGIDFENISSDIDIPSIPNIPSPESIPAVNDNHDFDDHFDFMDAAVSFAIQNKGLTSFSSVDYG